MKVKRYLLFAGDTYYPSGGWDDFQDSYDTEREAQNAARGKKTRQWPYDWTQIIDLETGEEI